jgi:hypothetical protein
MGRGFILFLGFVCWIHCAAPSEITVASTVEFKRSRGPANANTLRQFYKAINALSADPAINGSFVLIS